MREIKFRAWHKEDKIMWFPTLVSTGSERNAIYTYPDNEKTNNLVPNYPQDCELMQYTGFRDKNGKEIYEGDIVKYKNEVNDEIITPIEWSNECSGWFANRGGRLADLIHEQTIIRKKQFKEVDYPEIIGNIYENPELLK